MDKCKSCDADIIWSRASKTRKWLPLDAVRLNHGVRFVLDEDSIAYLETVGSGHPSHFATCSNNNEYRKNDKQGELDVG